MPKQLGRQSAESQPIAASGWTDLKKSADTRVIYVSSSGDDSHDGSTEAQAVATLAQGYSKLRDGYPDWLMLKAGDTWTKTFGAKWEKSGRSSTEKMVVTSYGDGAPPLLRAPLDGSTAALWIVDATTHLAIVGLEIKPAQRIPGESDFDANTITKNPLYGISVYNGPSDILIEGCRVSYYNTNIQVQSSGTSPKDIQLRRNVIANAYASSDTTHSQGLYSAGTVRLLVEENVFDHNGWNEMVTGAMPTVFNHNLYCGGAQDGLTIRGNLSVRASSMCFKIRSEQLSENTGLVVENNVCLEEPIGVSLGGTPPTGGLMYKDATVRGNVFSHLSATPGGPSTTCIGVDISSCDGAQITSNYMVDSSCGLGVMIQDLPDKGVVVSGNVFNKWSSMPIDNQAKDTSGITLMDNWVERPAAEYVDASRSIESYASAQGISGGVDGLVAEARKQTKTHWRIELSGTAITDYIAKGFTHH